MNPYQSFWITLYFMIKNFSIGNFVVFCITAFTCVFAYVWLVIVLVFISKNKVEVWEAVLTFLFFPILVCVAYAGDKVRLWIFFCYLLSCFWKILKILDFLVGTLLSHIKHLCDLRIKQISCLFIFSWKTTFHKDQIEAY